jgi:molybdopterin synthase catalytic subunit
MIEITESELPVAAVSNAASDALNGGAGAVVTFVGTVRNHSQGHQIHYLEYSAYKPMAEAEMRRIAEEARERWNLPCAMAHRVGRLEIGEASIVVAVASAHRKAAFEACHWIVDEVKSRVPIWKKEVAVDGYWWVEDPLNGPAAVTKEKTSAQV